MSWLDTFSEIRSTDWSKEPEPEREKKAREVVTITAYASRLGWTVVSLCDAALSFGGLTLATCPRATMNQPPKPFHF